MDWSLSAISCASRYAVPASKPDTPAAASFEPNRLTLPDIDLSLWRHASALVSIVLLLGGLVLESDR